MTSRRTAVDLMAGGVLLLLLAGVFAGWTTPGRPSVGAAGAVGAAAGPGTADPLTAGIAAAQQRLADVPGDWRT